MSKLKSNNSNMIALTLWLMLGLNAVFIWAEFLPFLATDFISWFDAGLESIRVPLTIVEFIAIGTLFVDLVVRYDSIKRRTLHVAAVGICVCGFVFKAFIYFLHSAYLS